MEVRCTVCGKVEEINKAHKDYERLAANRQKPYICYACSCKLSADAAKEKNKARNTELPLSDWSKRGF